MMLKCDDLSVDHKAADHLKKILKTDFELSLFVWKVLLKTVIIIMINWFICDEQPSQSNNQ